MSQFHCLGFPMHPSAFAENGVLMLLFLFQKMQQAFSELVRKYERLVYNLSYQASGNADDAFDISQEVFIKVYRSLRKFRGDCRFFTWLYRITMNTVKDYLRTQKRKKTVSLSDYDEEDENSPGTRDIPDDTAEADPEEMTERKERRALVRQAIGQLSEDHRIIITLRDMEGYSYEEIAEMLELEIGTVKSRLNRARQAIKEYLLERNIF